MATGLFGQKYSSRDYTDRQYWGKNQFNSSFPASLVAYMWWRRMSLVYLNTDTKGNIRQGSITAKSLFGIDPLSDDAYYNFEAGFPQ